jgi:hypothetical protein
LYVFNPDGSELGRSTASLRQDQVLKAVSQSGVYRVEVRDYAGSGEYVVDVSAGISQAPPVDQPPAVSFAQPAGGATLSGTVAVQVRASDDYQVGAVEFAVDGGAWTDITGGSDGKTYNYAWDSTDTADGAHTLTARVTDSAGQQATASVSVTVSNQAPPLAHELVRTGTVTSVHRDATFAVTVHEAGFLDLSLAWASRADLDFYVTGPDGSEIGRAYTLNNPEQLDTDFDAAGTWSIRVNLYAGSGTSYTLKWIVPEAILS